MNAGNKNDAMQRGRSPAARPIAHAEMARAARRHGAAVRSRALGFPHLRTGRKSGAAHLGGIHQPADEGSRCGHALRHALEPLRCSLGRRPFTEVCKLASAKPEAQFVMVHAEHGYTANVPLADLMRPTTLFALKHNGEPLPADHGYPRAPGGAASLRLEKREMGSRNRIHAARRARLLGAKRLPHLRRSVERAALLEQLAPQGPFRKLI